MATIYFNKHHFEDTCDGMLILNDVFIRTNRVETEAGYSMDIIHLVQDPNGAQIFTGTITPTVTEAEQAIKWLHLTGEKNWARNIVYDGFMDKANCEGSESLTNFSGHSNLSFNRAFELLKIFEVEAVMWDDRDKLVHRVAINLSDELIAGEIENLDELESNWLDSSDEWVVNYGDELLFDGLTNTEAESIREQIEELAYSFTKGIADRDIV